MSVLRSTAAPRASLVGAALLRPRLVLPATSQRQSVLAGCSLRNAGRSCSPNWAHQSLRAYATSPARPEAESVAPTSASKAADAFVHAPTSPAAANYPAVIYVGPVSKAFRFLKGFSLTSLVFSTSLSPFIFILDAPLGLAGRCFLAGCAISTTVLSTAMIGWCSAPYVSTIEILEPPTDEHPNPAIRLLTYTTLLQPRYTTLTTPLFLHESTRPLSTWQLRPLESPPTVAYPDIVAQTEDKNGKVLGRWDGEREEGQVVKTFMVHEDLLEGIWGLEGWRSHKTSDNP